MAREAFAKLTDGTLLAYGTLQKERKKRQFPVSTDSSVEFGVLGIIPADYLELKSENAQLKAENAVLKERVATMQANSAEELLEIREIPREQAKKEIKAFFEAHHSETIYPSDLMDALHLDYDLILELCNELEKEGKIKGL